jgi:cytochrome c553
MKRVTTIAVCLIAALLAGASTAAAQDDYAEVREVLETCAACHGPSGAAPIEPEFPILAGQHLHYLYVQLKDFKSGRRENEVMAEIAAGLEKDQMLLIAQFFSEQPWPGIPFRSDPAVAAKGETATSAGQCVQCHLGGYEGNSRIPRVAGQQFDYLNKTMTDFKTKARHNSPAKSTLMQSYAEDDIAAMAEFLAGL